jgi:uncharacterized protein YhbP (UPF0306 family)
MVLNTGEKIMDIEKVIRDYLPHVLHMSLATCVDNKPWVCEVHFVYDDDLNLYWRSKPSRRHSWDISENPHVAGNIVEQHALGDKPRGVYFEGTAEMLHEVAPDDPAVKLFMERLKLGPEIVSDANQLDGHKMYKVTVTDWYVFDSRESSPSQKYHLNRSGV